MKTKRKILVINGPNLQLLGKREPHIYGCETLRDVADMLVKIAKKHDVELDFFQSCIEGEIVEIIGNTLLEKNYDGIMINPGAYAHTSIAILDAIKAVTIPVIELHISNVHAREEFRHNAMTARGAKAMLCGFGVNSYKLALYGLIDILDEIN